MNKIFRSISTLFALISAGTFLFILFIGLIAIAQKNLPVQAMSSMKGMASALSSPFFVDMMSVEIPHMKADESHLAFEKGKAFGIALQMLTNINPNDPRSLLAGEIPGMKNESISILYKGIATVPGDYPRDYIPPANVYSAEETTPISPIPESKDNLPAPSSTEPKNVPDGTEKKKAVLIYHSHNRESFLPELKNVTNPDRAYDSKINISLVGKRLSEKLEDLGIGTIHATVDYPNLVPDFNYAKSYAYSYATVREALATHSDIQLIFDIHRDSLERKRTTVEINGKTYAQIYFVVGKRNPQWEKNSDFANTIHTMLEKQYPGISRGIFGKSSHGNAEYNQSLSPNSILMEIGGPYNTLDEMNLTVDLLARVIADMYWEAEKVNISAKTSG